MSKRSIDGFFDTTSKRQKTDNNEEWHNNLTNLKQYIEINEKLPSIRSKYGDILKLAKWYYEQKKNYLNNISIMKNEDNRKQWNNFMIEYYDKIKSNITFENNIDKIKKFIENSGKQPSIISLNNEEKYLARWLDNQKQNINVRDDKIRKIWDEFNRNYLLHDGKEWNDKLDTLKQYIDINKAIPLQCDENYETRLLSLWLCRQKRYFKSNIMKEEYLVKWKDFIENYGHYILSSEEEWYIKLEILKKYIDENKEKPQQKANYLGNWLSMQHQYYKLHKYNLRHEKVREKWEEFTRDYKEYLVQTEIWFNRLNMVKEFIDKNKKIPPKNSKLYNWIKTQQKNDSNKRLKDEYVKDWYEFIKIYGKYFKNKDCQWFTILEKIKIFIHENNNFPSPYHKNKNTRILGKWLEKQHYNYNNQKYLMRNTNIKNTWEQFKGQYYTPDKYWKNALNNVINYINNYKKIPSDNSNNKNIRGLYVWMNAQQNNYHKKSGAMKNQELRDLWDKFLIDHKDIIILTN